MSKHPKPPGPFDSVKFEVMEQELLDKGQAARAEGTFKMNQIFCQLAKLTENINFEEIAHAAGSEADVKALAAIDGAATRWQTALGMLRDHAAKCRDIIQAEITAGHSTIALLNQMKKLPMDSEMVDRLRNIKELLDGIEAHRQSGLLEAISKL